MFTSAHFLWLGAIAAGIAAFFILIKALKLPSTLVHRATTAALIVLKLFHLSLSMKESPFGGLVIDQTQLSFHVCSIMIYAVILTNFIKNEELLGKIRSFMVPCLMIGALMALLIPTEGVDPSVPRVWQYMLIHGVLVFYGLHLAFIDRVDLSFKAYLNNLKFMLCLVLAALLMNSVLEAYGTNFLFLRVPPMEGLPILNLDQGWFVYVLSLSAVAAVLLLLGHAPYMISHAVRKRSDRRRE